MSELHTYEPCRRLYGKANEHDCAAYEHCELCGDFPGAPCHECPCGHIEAAHQKDCCIGVSEGMVCECPRYEKAQDFGERPRECQLDDLFGCIETHGFPTDREAWAKIVEPALAACAGAADPQPGELSSLRKYAEVIGELIKRLNSSGSDDVILLNTFDELARLRERATKAEAEAGALREKVRCYASELADPSMEVEDTRLAKAEAEVARLRDEIEALKALDASKSPCGHSASYAHTEDGGKHITCLLCRAEAAESALTALRTRLEGLASVLREERTAGRNYLPLGYAADQLTAILAETKAPEPSLAEKDGLVTTG